MKSKIVDALNLKYNSVALIWTDKKPIDALQFKKGRWGCVVSMFANAAKGRTAVLDRETCGCWGGGVGLGFGNQYVNFPGGEECFCHFLSTGNKQWDTGKNVADKIEKHARKEFLEDFLYGERYFKSPQLVRKFINSMPIIDIPAEYVVFKPLKDVDLNREQPVVIIFLTNPNQLSALVILANYGRGDGDNVIIPYAAGCQTIGIFPYRETKSDNPRAVVGLTDISARENVKGIIGENLLSFAVPLKMFQEMEDNVEGSFLQRRTWEVLMEQNNQ